LLGGVNDAVVTLVPVPVAFAGVEASMARAMRPPP
jgi:hypothetical protein